MNLHRMAVLSAALLLLSPISPAAASSDVLLPEDNDALPAPTSGDVSLPVVNPPSSNSTGSVGDESLPRQSSTPDGALPPPTFNPGVVVGVPTVTGSGKSLKINLPTNVIREPDPVADIVDPNAPKPTHSVRVVFADKALTEADVNTVNDTLGIEKSKVLSLCTLRASGSLLSDMMTYRVDTGTSHVTDVGYLGDLRTVMLSVTAYCKDVPLPPYQGFVRQVGDKYVVSLGSIYCQVATPKPPRKVIMHRAGGGVMGTGHCDIE